MNGPDELDNQMSRRDVGDRVSDRDQISFGGVRFNFRSVNLGTVITWGITIISAASAAATVVWTLGTNYERIVNKINNLESAQIEMSARMTEMHDNRNTQLTQLEQSFHHEMDVADLSAKEETRRLDAAVQEEKRLREQLGIDIHQGLEGIYRRLDELNNRIGTNHASH